MVKGNLDTSKSNCVSFDCALNVSSLAYWLNGLIKLLGNEYFTWDTLGVQLPRLYETLVTDIYVIHIFFLRLSRGQVNARIRYAPIVVES